MASCSVVEAEHDEQKDGAAAAVGMTGFQSCQRNFVVPGEGPYCELASPISCPISLQRIGLCPVSVQLSWQRTIAHFTVRAFSGHRKVSLTALEPCHPDSSSRTILLLVMLGLSHSTALHCSSVFF